MVRGTSEVTFADRDEAGRRLGDEVARLLPADGPDRPLVLALPRGGVPVAVQVAERLNGDLDLLLARKIGAPGQPEYGVGAIAEDGPPVFDTTALGRLGLTVGDLTGTVKAERAELARRARRYRDGRPPPRVAGRRVVLVDDGLATGVTARAALRGLCVQRPATLVLAVPVGAPAAFEALGAEADRVISLAAPPGFRAVGEWYRDFHQLTDEDVDRALRGFASAQPGSD